MCRNDLNKKDTYDSSVTSATKIIDSTVAAVLIEYSWRISPDLGFQSLV